jgi:predicted small metal-binding protein
VTHREVDMHKLLNCGEMFSGCDTVIYGNDEDDVIAKEEDHVRKEHNMVIIPMDTIKEMTMHVKDGEPPHRRWFGLG